MTVTTTHYSKSSSVSTTHLSKSTEIAVDTSYLLLGSGDYALLESGDVLLLESEGTTGITHLTKSSNVTTTHLTKS